MMTIGERLKAIRGTRPQEEIGAALGVHKNTFANYESNKRVPDAIFLNKVLEVFPDLEPGWLLTGKGEMKRGYPIPGEVITAGSVAENRWKAEDYEKGKERIKRRVDDQYCYIPLYDVQASAGGGALVDRENLIEFLAFKAEWIRTQLHASQQDLYLIYVQGESMEPTLRPGDVILVDHREASTLPRDGIYVVTIDGTLLVKRLQRLPGGVINVTSDNPAYQPFSVNLVKESNGMAIIGRVVWCGRRM